MYSFAQRRDTRVVDEPFYALYLLKTNANHPAKEDVLNAQPTGENAVRKQLEDLHDREVLFIKNMAHHMEVLSNPLIDGTVNVFLIRDPRLILSSYTQVIEKPALRDIALAFQCELFDLLRKRGQTAIVVDSARLLENPEVVLTKLCQKCGISFDRSMLKWPAGPKPYDGVWAKYWYSNVHRSEGFNTNITQSRQLPDYLVPVYQQARRYYEKLRAFSLKA